MKKPTTSLYAAALQQAMGGTTYLDGGSKYGWTHKQQIGWHGQGYALYVWIIDGNCYLVGEQVGSDPNRPIGQLEGCSLAFIGGCELASKIPNLTSYFNSFPGGYALPATAAAAGLVRTLSYPNFVAPNNATYTPPANTGGSTSGGGGSTSSGGGSTSGAATVPGFFTTYKTPIIIGLAIVAVALVGWVVWKNR